MNEEFKPVRPYVLKKSEGWVYRYGIDINVKAGEVHGPANAAFMTYQSKPGDEAETHTHATEDEMFYVLKGTIRFHCGEDSCKVKKGGFVFLPHGIPHSYKVVGKRPARVIVVTTPAREMGKQGWGGFVSAMEEGQAELVEKPSFEE